MNRFVVVLMLLWALPVCASDFLDGLLPKNAATLFKGEGANANKWSVELKDAWREWRRNAAASLGEAEQNAELRRHAGGEMNDQSRKCWLWSKVADQAEDTVRWVIRKAMETKTAAPGWVSLAGVRARERATKECSDSDGDPGGSVGAAYLRAAEKMGLSAARGSVALGVGLGVVGDASAAASWLPALLLTPAQACASDRRLPGCQQGDGT